MQTGQAGPSGFDGEVSVDLGHPSGQTTGTEARASHTVAGSMLSFDLTQECEQLRREEPWLKGDRNAKTLIKQRDLRVVLLMLKQGAVVETHKADGRLTVHALSGHARLTMNGHTIDLRANHLAEVAPNVPHDVEAIEESSLLLTISWSGNR